MVYKLFLDDVRPAPEGWVLAKNFEEFKALIGAFGCPDVIAFDHDLSNEHYKALFNNSEDYGTVPTGYDCAKLLVDKGCIPSIVVIHTWNSPGGYRIYNLFHTKTTTYRVPYGSENYNNVMAFIEAKLTSKASV